MPLLSEVASAELQVVLANSSKTHRLPCSANLLSQALAVMHLLLVACSVVNLNNSSRQAHLEVSKEMLLKIKDNNLEDTVAFLKLLNRILPLGVVVQDSGPKQASEVLLLDNLELG